MRLGELEAELTRLGISLEEVQGAPQITPLLRRVGLLRQFVSYLRTSKDPDARAYLAVYDSLPGRWRRGLPVEAVCLAAGLTTKRLYEVLAGSLFTQGHHEERLLSAAARGRVVKASIKFALTPEGEGDRKMLHQAAGFLPLPKNQFVNLPGVKTIDARVQNLVLPSVESGVKRMAERFGERLLPPVPSEPEEPGEDDELPEEED